MSDTEFEGFVGATANTSIYDVNWCCQTFTIGTVGTNVKHDVTSIKLRLARSAVSHTNNFTVAIYETSGGLPTGAALWSTNIAGSSLTTSNAWYEYTVTGVTFEKSTMYVIVLSYALGDASKYIKWYRGNQGYTGGKPYSSSDSGSNWSEISGFDFGFYEYGTAIYELVLSETVTISEHLATTGDYCSLETIKIRYGSNLNDYICLHKPYWNGANGNVSLSNTNLSFRSGNYASYIDGISGEGLTIIGYENNDAITKLELLSSLSDDGTELTVTNLNSQFVGVYVIESLSYRPLGLDVFEYNITFKWVRDV